MQDERVSECMSSPPILVASTTSLAKAQQLMEERNIRRLLVVDRDQLIGIVTWGDLRAAQPSAATTLSVYEWRALLDRVTVSECMTRHPQTIAPDATALDAARLMLKYKIGGLPVVAEGQVLGVITESDLFRLMIADVEEHAEDPRMVLKCWHCGTELRRRTFATLGPNDVCWNCQYHLHRCENCTHFDIVACMLGRSEQQSTVPGQHCPVFELLPGRVAVPAPQDAMR